jgi:hypothetical protein
MRFDRIVILSAFSAFQLVAQSETATLRGTVADTKGNALPGITIVITDSDAGTAVREVATGPGGRYEVSYLRPGSYELVIDANHYQRVEVDGIRLDPGQVRTYDVQLISERPTETTQVHESGRPIHSESGTIGDPIDAKARWNDTPSFDRRQTALPLLVTAPAIQGTGNGLVISGISSRDQQTWALDGVPLDTIRQTGNPAFFETIETTIANPGVESSRPVNFNMVSRHGGEAFHGQVYYKRGSSALSANSYLNTQNQRYHLNEAGGQLGGALIPKWTYVFAGGAYQKMTYRETLYADVATTQMRAFDFSQYLNAATSPTGKVVVLRDPRTGTPFPNNRIPSNRISGLALNYLNNYYPAPNRGDANTFSQNYSWDHPYGPEPNGGNWPFGRVDQKLATANQLYFRWMQSQMSSVAPGSVGEQLNSTQNARYRSLVLADVYGISSSLANRFSIFRTGVRVKQGEGEGNVNPTPGDSFVSTLGLQGVNPNAYSVMGFPSVSIAGLTGMSMAYGGGYSNNVAQSDGVTGFEDSVTWSYGRHAVKAGVQFTHYSWLQGAVPQSLYGSFNFSGAFTGVGFADFLLGFPETSTRTDVSVDRRLHQRQAGLFAADSFRITSRLTLDYGVRWDYYSSPVYNDGYMYNWDPTTGAVIVAPGTVTSVSPYYPKNIRVTLGNVVPKARMTNIRPRVSAAYRIKDNFVVRGGYGEFTVNPGYGTNGALNNSNPFDLTETYTNSFVNSLPAFQFPKPFPSTPSTTLVANQSVTALPMETREGVIRQYNATLEREVHGFAVRVSYIGFRGSEMNYTLDTNKPAASTIPFTVSRKPFPQFVSTYVTRTDGQWHYDSGVLQVQKRTGPVTFQSSLTLANNVANYLNTEDPYNVTNHWTRDAADRRKYFVTSAYWPISFGKGPWLGGWTVQAISTFASGQYFSPLFTGPDPANASAGYVTQLADCVGDPKTGAGTLNQWFNPAAFAIPSSTAGRYGTCAMNSLEGYPIHVAHVSLAKRIPLGETLSALFTAQVSNVTNTSHFTTPNNNLSNPDPGRFTTSSVAVDYPERMGYRQIDLKLRLQW